MRDPYLYDDLPVLKNLLGIKDAASLECAEADIAFLRLYIVDEAVQGEVFDLSRLLAIHKHIFGDIFEWAGTIRTIQMVKGERVLGGDTVRYSQPDDIERDCTAVLEKLNDTDWTALGVRETAEAFTKLIAELWQVHPFRKEIFPTASIY